MKRTMNNESILALVSNIEIEMKHHRYQCFFFKPYHWYSTHNLENLPVFCQLEKSPKRTEDLARIKDLSS